MNRCDPRTEAAITAIMAHCKAHGLSAHTSRSQSLTFRKKGPAQKRLAHLAQFRQQWNFSDGSSLFSNDRLLPSLDVDLV